LAIGQGAAGSCCAVADWLERQATNWFAQDTATSRLSCYVFAFHDGDEIGPPMLSRIAKRTGLKPEDL
jgi:hypothetical protein